MLDHTIYICRFVILVLAHSWLQLMSADNQEFMVVGVLGTQGAGKSTIMNEIYGFETAAQGEERKTFLTQYGFADGLFAQCLRLFRFY